MKISSHSERYILMQKLSRRGEENPSRCIVLKNMVEPDEIDSELQTEIKDECSKFGKIDQLVIYQQEVNGQIEVKVFILFETADGATNAQSKLHDRFFNERRVHCEFYDEKSFLERKFEN
jgi:splicing factor 45